MHPLSVWKPTREQVEAARGKALADLLALDLRVLFCGINPSLYSAAVGHHFARPGNRFWPTVHAAGFSDRRLAPAEESELVARRSGLGGGAAAAPPRPRHPHPRGPRPRRRGGAAPGRAGRGGPAAAGQGAAL